MYRRLVMALICATTIHAASLPRQATASLADICTGSNVLSILPTNEELLGIELIASNVIATAVYNSSQGSTGGMGAGPGASTSSANYPYCNVTVTYTHPGKNDEVVVKYAFPQPSDFKNRFYVAGGGGYSLSTSATGGLEYGAVGGATSAGYDAFTVSFDDAVLTGNGSINWDATNMFGYQALGEMTKLGKALTNSFYGLSNNTKIYTYYEGCSDGGREGMSQIQRWGEEYDGAIIGAPAFRYAQQQVNHIFSSVVEHTLDYYPPPCAIEKIVNATIVACDPLDGRTDSVVARTDLCMLQFNLSSIIGESYYCAAQTISSLGFGFDGSNNSTMSKRQMGAAGSTSSNVPEQNGTVTANDVAVAQTILDGLHNSQGERAYLSWQISSSFGDTATTWNNETNAWELNIPSTGGEFITKFVQLVNETNLSNLDGITYDTVVEWMQIAYERYLATLQTTVPDLTPFQAHGGKLIHYHGEADGSVPTASSVHYYQSVQSIMYPNETNANMSDWYQLYIVPGAGHCGTNTLQPGPYPENNMNIMIDWVENGNQPSRLNATVTSGEYAGEIQMLCQWPQRPLWSSDTTFDCVDDEEESLETWTYTFPAFKVPIY